MKTDKNILIAFILNLSFSIFEFIGGSLTGSVAIISDAIHDMGDAISIGISYVLERKSRQRPDDSHTFGYVRYSVFGSLIVSGILFISSLFVIYQAVLRLFNPVQIHYDGVIIFAIVGVCLNLIAAWVTHEGDSLNQKAVNLHMLEDVLGWVVVLIGAIIMRFTDISIIDPILSILVAIFILFHTFRNLKICFDLFVEKTPDQLEMNQIIEQLHELEGVENVHHLHLWSHDGFHHYATMHVVTQANPQQIKQQIRALLEKHGIIHVTLELEDSLTHCQDHHCHLPLESHNHNHHHHHH